MTARELAKSLNLTIACTWVDDQRSFSFCIPMLTFLDETSAAMRGQTIGFGNTPEAAERQYCELVRGLRYRKHSFYNDDTINQIPGDLTGPADNTDWIQSLIPHPVSAAPQ